VLEGLRRYRGYILIVLVNLIITGAVVIFMSRPAPKTIAIEVATPAPVPSLTPPLPRQIVVYVSGAVQSPGVYTLPDGARVDDALRAAGGPAADADLARINLARRLHDEEQVYVPRQGEANPPVPAAGATSGGSTTSGRLNINTATATELATLPGIGPALAQRIVEYRQTHGPFARIEDLKKVSGIGDKVFERIKDLITI